MILSSDKSSERNLSCFFDIIKPRRLEHLLSEEPLSSDPYFNSKFFNLGVLNSNMNMSDTLSPLGSPIVLQRKGSVYGANVPMITG